MTLKKATTAGVRCRLLWIKMAIATFQPISVSVVAKATPIIPNEPIISMQPAKLEPAHTARITAPARSFPVIVMRCC